MPRTLDEIKLSSGILSGVESQMLRTFCTSEYMNPQRDLGDPYGSLLANGDLSSFREHFDTRVESLSGDRSAATQELYQQKWGPTKIPVYNILLTFNYMHPSSRSKYLALAEWLAKTAKVPVDGTDLSGTTAFMHSISTKPYFDTQFAQTMLDNGADINHRNRYGCTAAHDIVQVYQFDAPTIDKSANALRLFLEKGGDVNIKDGDGTTARFVVERMARMTPGLNSVLKEFGQTNAQGSGQNAGSKKPARNDPCSCGSSKKYKKCCGIAAN